MILGILQVRTSSSRLPGKALLPLFGAPLVLRVTERIGRARSLDGLVVATSVDPSDDELAAVLEQAGLTVRRGSLTDVLGRFLQVVEEFDPETVVRLTADNPLVDPEVIDLVVDAHRAGSVDYTSNSLTRTFPRGLDVEVASAAALRRLAGLLPSEEEREHVTMGLYQRPESFSIEQVVQATNQSELRWTVDYPQDLTFAEAVYKELYVQNPCFGRDEVIRLLERNPQLRHTDADAATWASPRATPRLVAGPAE